MDAEKSEYSEYYNFVINKIRPGGWIITDNVLWGEKILENPADSDHSTRGILEFNEMVLHDERVENLILPIRDGVLLIRKK
jgi:predicted O-methyltransferase YrrM